MYMYMSKKLIKNFGYACKGLLIAWREEQNFRVELLIALVAIILSLILHITKTEWAIVSLTIFTVLSVEALNTALEEVCDKFHPDHDPHIGKIKDLAAAAVLLVSIGALIVALLIFLPYIT